MTKRMDRYMLREMIVPLLIGVVVIGLLFLGNEFMALFKQLEVTRVPTLSILQLALYRMPYWFTYTLPAGVSLAVALGVSRLVRESEVTALRSAGVSIKRILFMPVVVGLVGAGITWWLTEWVVPNTERGHQKLSAEVLAIAANPRFESNLMIRIPPYVARFGSVSRDDDSRLTLNDIFLAEQPKPGELWVYTAETGSYRDGIWRFDNAIFRIFQGPNVVSFEAGRSLEINQKIDIPSLFMPASASTETAREVWEKIERNQSAGIATRELELLFYEKFAIPATCVIFALTSALMAVRFARLGPFVGVLLGFGLAALYFNVHVLGFQIIGRNAWAPPLVAASIPGGLYFLMALFVGRKIE
ncbi:MAG: LptF/LptG family permease [Fimbriimonadaceae bacterium]|jgi:lipopolysaccharide export system permease protein|nr:LptF/LptG family permease [Fimbriimonadaceae bacterium]